MNKLQKIAFTLFVILSLVLGYLGYQALKRTKQPSVKAISLVPAGCDLMLSFDDYSEFSNSLRHKNLLWQDVQHISALAPLEKHFHYFDSLITSNELLEETIDGNPVYLGAYPQNKFLIICNVKELADQEVHREIFKKLTNSLAMMAMVAVVQDGVIGISNSQDALDKMFSRKNTGLIQNKGFQKLTDAANYSGTSLYTGKTANSKWLRNSYSNLSIRPDRIIFNGIKIPDSTEFFGEINAAPHSEMEFLNNIPLICNAFEAYAVNNAEGLFSNNTGNNWWQKVNEEALFNAKKQFYSNIHGCIVKTSMPSGKKSLIINITDSIKMSEIIPFMCVADTSGKARIRELKNSASFVASTFPGLISSELKYIAAFSDRIVLTPSMDDAEIFLNAGLNQSSILSNRNFRQFAAANFDSEFHYLSYQLINSLNSKEIPFNNLLTENDAGLMKNISHCSFVASMKNKFLSYRLNLSYSQENFIDEPGVLWTMNTDTNIVTKPYLFKNHITRGNEIVFQTANRQLYLQSATGKTIWKKELNELLRSEVFIIDAFKNGKYQLLFNTDHYLHLIDRNGNYVQGYPVRLPATATNKLAVINYENKNEPRLFIACADKKIYNYSVWGIKQEGFKPFPTSAEVTLPVKYCSVGLSDYLVTADRKGKVYAFSRKGDGRIDFINKLIEDAESFELECGNFLANTQIVYYDEKGSLAEKISLTDKKEIFKTLARETSSAYCFVDFDKNKIMDVVIAGSDRLEVYDLNGARNFVMDFAEELVPASIKVYHPGHNTYVNIHDTINSTAFIIDLAEKTTRKFKSTQPGLICNLFNDGKVYLLAVMNGELKCVKL